MYLNVQDNEITTNIIQSSIFIQRSRKNASSTLPCLLNSTNKNFFKDRLFSTYELTGDHNRLSKLNTYIQIK